MFRIALQIGLTVTAFLITASVSLATECADDPNECTPKKLCEIATDTYGGDGNISWSAASSKAKHVTFAQGLGMSCGVIAALDPCDSDPNECKISQLCGKATIESAGQISWDDSAEAYVALAKDYGLSCDVSEEIITEKVTPDFKQAFKSAPKLKRQQLQYALKKLGYYSYGADGLWGEGTSAALFNFVSGYDLENKSEVEVFRSLLSKIKVPSSFDVPKKKVGKNGLFPEYVCKTNKVDMKSSVFGLSTNKGMTMATLVAPDGQRKKLNQKETREVIKEFKLDEPLVFKFRDNKVKYVNPLMGKKEISELLKAVSPEDKPELTRIVEKFFAPIIYKIDNNVASWSQNFSLPKLMPGFRMTAAHSLNSLTNQYILKAKVKAPYFAGEMKMTAWATCD